MILSTLLLLLGLDRGHGGQDKYEKVLFVNSSLGALGLIGEES